MKFFRFIVLINALLIASGCDKEGSPQANSAADSGSSFTNVQEGGIDESDRYKIGDNQIFLANESGIDVLTRAELDYVGRIPLESVESLYVTFELLIALVNAEIYIYRLSTSGNLPTLEKHVVFAPGAEILDSRITKNHLILVTSSRELKFDGDTVNGIPCNQVVKPSSASRSLLTVHDFNLDDPTQDPQTFSVLDNYQHLYLNEHLYLAESSADWDSTIVMKVENRSEGPRARAIGSVPGQIKDRWALKEKEDSLLVATTDWINRTNGLYALRPKNDNLEIISSVDGFAKNEDVRAIRYVKDTAYVVTFEKTDPLFALDVSNPHDLKMLGELKIPGFSTYLHPVEDDLLLGVGYDAEDMGNFSYFQGLQFSLFDVRNPLKMKRLDVAILGDRGSASEVTSNPHAFHYDPENKIAGIPLTLFHRTGDNPWDYGSELEFSGAALFSVAENKIRELRRISHYEHIPQNCRWMSTSWWRNNYVPRDINRLYKVDNRLIALSPFAVTAYNSPDGNDLAKTLVIPDSDCQAWGNHARW